MQITQSTLEKALFRIIREHGMGKYDAIPLRELRELWGASGLRYDDLREALRAMFEENYVDFASNAQGLNVVLKPDGHARAQAMGIHLLSLLRDAQDSYALYRVAQRGAVYLGGTEPLQERRQE